MLGLRPEVPMRRALGLAAVTMAILVGCGQDDSASGTAAPEVISAPAPAAGDVAALKTLFEKIDSNCAGNDNGFVEKFDVATFDAAAVMKEIKADEEDHNGCAEFRSYSKSREEGVKEFHDYLVQDFDETNTCLAENLAPEERKTLDTIIDDPANLAVISNVQGGGDSEACGYTHFHVYRADGIALHFVFDHTD